jgi:hypothetical protein
MIRGTRFCVGDITVQLNALRQSFKRSTYLRQKVHSTFNCGSSRFAGKPSVLGVICGMIIACLTAKRRRETLTQCGFKKICFGYSRLACSPSVLHIQDRQNNQRAAKRFSEPCNIYRRTGYYGVFEPHLGNIVFRDSNGLNDNNEGVCRWLSGKSHSTLFPNCHGGVMYGSVDNSWNDCIHEKNLIIKNNKSYIAARDQIDSAPKYSQHNCTCMW